MPVQKSQESHLPVDNLHQHMLVLRPMLHDTQRDELNQVQRRKSKEVNCNHSVTALMQ